MAMEAGTPRGREHSWPHVEALVIIETTLTFLQAVIQNDLETLCAITQQLGMDTEEGAWLIAAVRYTFRWAREQEKNGQAMQSIPQAQEEEKEP